MMRPSVQGVDPPVCCISWMLLLHMQETVFVDSPAGPFVFSRGGPGILDVTVTYARDSFCGFTGWAFYPLEGGPRYPGTSLTLTAILLTWTTVLKAQTNTYIHTHIQSSTV